ncbi:hypothetical protein ACJIZ3_008989 [Penstemon smallii]|uniref:Putative plant transposon protein domain-containing protein n=1 Tax=Penstemon smallii TaxID=265156 RepID=A0ABD3TCZ0_9LAMI
MKLVGIDYTLVSVLYLSIDCSCGVIVLVRKSYGTTKSNDPKETPCEQISGSDRIDEKGESFITERGVECTPESFPEFYRLFQKWGWMDFIKQPTEIEGEIIREFYANVSQTPDAKVVKVRGRMVKFDKATINTLYKLPTYAIDQYTTCLADAIDMKDIVEFICLSGTVLPTTGNFLKASLTPVAKIWFAFIASRLMPTTHYTKISKDKARLIYSLMKGHTVDIGELICKGFIRNATKEGAQTFWFPSLIFRLCIQVEVQMGEGVGDGNGPKVSKKRSGKQKF